MGNFSVVVVMFHGEQPPQDSSRLEKSMENDIPLVPESEMRIQFTLSSGPGGQNVNKRKTQAQLFWHIGSSNVFSAEQKETIRRYAAGRLNENDEIYIFAKTERSQLQNKNAVIARLQELITDALTPQAERKPTKVSRSQKEKRLEEKRKDSAKKQERKRQSYDL